jgi:acetyl-CoA C-acetyltransferase
VQQHRRGRVAAARLDEVEAAVHGAHATLNSMAREAVIVDAVRSPVGRAHKGSLVEARPDDLCAHVVRALLDRNGGGELRVDEVICGVGYPFGEQGYNVARAAALLAGLPDTTPAHTVSRLCASSLQAIRAAHHAIALGEGDVYVACGVESVTRVGRDSHLREPNPRLPAFYMPMIETAEKVAVRYGVTREEMDRYAQRSQELAVAAQRDGTFDREIVPWNGAVQDDGPRPASSLEKLAELEPVLGPEGRVTAGNSCPLNDGAAAVLVASAERAEALGLRPRARIVASAVSALDPTIMGVAPIDAVRRVLERAGVGIGDVDAFELNEAFAAQVLPVAHEVGIDPYDDRFNGTGGAIALGHPFGMTGARIMTTLLNRLETVDGELGLETMCVGGGQGQAMVVRRLR